MDTPHDRSGIHLRDAQTGRDFDLVLEVSVDFDEVVERLLKRAEVEGRSMTRNRLSPPEVCHGRLNRWSPTTPTRTLVQIDGLGTVDEVWDIVYKVLDEHNLLPQN